MDTVKKTAKCEHCGGDLESSLRMAGSKNPDTWSHTNQADRTNGGLHAAFPAADTIEVVK